VTGAHTQALPLGPLQVARPQDEGPYYLLDGAHTADSAAALAAAARAAFPEAPIVLVLAMAGAPACRPQLCQACCPVREPCTCAQCWP
jgi:folylpolyglutamate synthase/dihydropteroate synthase